MYLEHFGLQEPPFSLTPDTAFFFAHGQFREALNTVLVAVRSGEGFIKVSGEVGTGKTLLCRKLLGALDDGFHTAYIPNPYLSPAALNLALAEELGISGNPDPHQIIKAITGRLVTLHGEGRKTVLCIDEAQAMPDETLEALRLLTNLETEKRKLLQVVLFGQPELDERLARPGARQLRQRITFSHRLRPLGCKELRAYVDHRLGVAGAGRRVEFQPHALSRLHRASGGIPRLVNILAHKALMACYGQGMHEVTAAHVAVAVRDSEQVPVPRLRFLGTAAAGTALLAALALGAAILRGGVLPGGAP